MAGKGGHSDFCHRFLKAKGGRGLTTNKCRSVVVSLENCEVKKRKVDRLQLEALETCSPHTRVSRWILRLALLRDKQSVAMPSVKGSVCEWREGCYQKARLLILMCANK